MKNSAWKRADESSRKQPWNLDDGMMPWQVNDCNDERIELLQTQLDMMTRASTKEMYLRVKELVTSLTVKDVLVQKLSNEMTEQKDALSN
ncbi:hypothetical protein Tco_0360259 [Tanacetum coccineum]